MPAPPQSRPATGGAAAGRPKSGAAAGSAATGKRSALGQAASPAAAAGVAAADELRKRAELLERSLRAEEAARNLAQLERVRGVVWEGAAHAAMLGAVAGGQHDRLRAPYVPERFPAAAAPKPPSTTPHAAPPFKSQAAAAPPPTHPCAPAALRCTAHPQDKVAAFWEVTRRELGDARGAARVKDRELEEAQVGAGRGLAGGCQRGACRRDSACGCSCDGSVRCQPTHPTTTACHHTHRTSTRRSSRCTGSASSTCCTSTPAPRRAWRRRARPRSRSRWAGGRAAWARVQWVCAGRDVGVRGWSAVGVCAGRGEGVGGWSAVGVCRQGCGCGRLERSGCRCRLQAKGWHRSRCCKAACALALPSTRAAPLTPFHPCCHHRCRLRQADAFAAQEARLCDDKRALKAHAREQEAGAELLIRQFRCGSGAGTSLGRQGRGRAGQGP